VPGCAPRARTTCVSPRLTVRNAPAARGGPARPVDGGRGRGRDAAGAARDGKRCTTSAPSLLLLPMNARAS